MTAGKVVVFAVPVTYALGGLAPSRAMPYPTLELEELKAARNVEKTRPEKSGFSFVTKASSVPANAEI